VHALLAAVFYFVFGDSSFGATKYFHVADFQIELRV
jgi:hypothetical protein